MSIVFTDVDDVLVLKRTIDFNKHAPNWSEDICRRLLHPPAMQVLTSLTEDGARIVITSNWVRFLDRAGFQQLFEGGGYAGIGSALHVAWQAPPVPTGNRFDAINAWLAQHHIGESFAILDDPASGSSLRGSQHDLDGRLVLCQPGVGLNPGHLPAVRAALAKPVPPAQPERPVTPS